ncbi:MAG TPA: YraN family protein [Abditibacterium sp.]|jgi:putative endonuclease
MTRLSSPSAQRGSAQRGRDGEDLAAAFLRVKGAQIIARNWRPSGTGVRGEIDIIAQCGEFLCFVEVKTRRGQAHGAPQEAVNGAKQRQISRLANAYLSLQNDADVPCRFDIIEVWLAPPQKPRIHWLENAFDFQG